MPRGSTVVVYGALSAEACSELSPIDLIFSDKRVEAFYLGEWLKKKSFLGSMRTVRKAHRMIADGTLRTEIARRIPLGELKPGLIDYLEHLSEGKAVLLLR